MFSFQFDKLNRQGEMRQDSDFIRSAIDHPNTLFLPLFRQRVSSTDKGANWLNKNELAEKIGKLSDIHFIYLGLIDKQHYFAYRVASLEALETISTSSSDLRNLIAVLNKKDSYLVNVATALNQWHSVHQFCGYCGHETYAMDLGFVRKCSNQECAKQHFPRTDPAIIVAITHTDDKGQEKILLGRQSSWEDNRYSNVAGFVEPGESLEQAVKREALEEVGIEVSQVEYIASQPWPFPQSVMLGFKAKAVTTEITLKDKELENAAWFSREEIHNLIKAEKLILPMNYSISRHIIELWLK